MGLRAGLVGGLALCLATGGCAGSVPQVRHRPAAAVSARAASCREQWSSLGDRLDRRTASVEPSGLPDRWNAIVATARYYASSADAGDCPAALERAQRSAAQLEAFGRRLQKFDPVHQRAVLRAPVLAYLAAPLPEPRHRAPRVTKL
jgi:hypothetical protein